MRVWLVGDHLLLSACETPAKHLQSRPFYLFLFWRQATRPRPSKYGPLSGSRVSDMPQRVAKWACVLCGCNRLRGSCVWAVQTCGECEFPCPPSNSLRRSCASDVQRLGDMQICWSATSAFGTKWMSIFKKLDKSAILQTSGATSSNEMKVERQKLNYHFKRLTSSDATLSHQMRDECQKLTLNRSL